MITSRSVLETQVHVLQRDEGSELLKKAKQLERRAQSGVRDQSAMNGNQLFDERHRKFKGHQIAKSKFLPLKR